MDPPQGASCLFQVVVEKIYYGFKAIFGVTVIESVAKSIVYFVVFVLYAVCPFLDQYLFLQTRPN